MKEKISNDNIFVDQPSGELTFGKIFKVLKCSLLRMLVYLLVACIIASTIALVLTVSNKTDASVSTVIAYTHTGVDQGKGPDNEAFSVERIKNTNVLNSAIKTSKLENVEGLNATSLAPHIIIEGIIPSDIYAKIEDLKAQANKDKNANEQLNKLVYYPNRYVLKFNAFDKFDLTEKQAATLLENIIKAYQSDWNDKYYPEPNVPTTIFDQIIDKKSNYEYIDYAPLLEKHIEQLNKFIENYQKSSFISIQNNGKDKVSFSSLLTELDILKKDINDFNSFININHVYRDVKVVEATLLDSKLVLTEKLEILESSKTATQKQIDDIHHNKPTDDSIITRPDGSTETLHRYPPIYNKLQEDIMRINSEMALVKEQLADVQRKLDKVDELKTSDALLPPANTAYADKLLVDISNKYLDLVKKAQQFAIDYKENGIITEDVQCNTPISRSSKTSLSNKIILVIFLLGAVVAIIAAISVTVVKQKTFAFKKAKADKEALAVSNDTPIEPVADTKVDSEEEPSKEE